MPVIDADGHVFEPETMFSELPREVYPRRPIPVFLPTDTERGDRNGCWIIEGKTYPTIGGRGHNLFDIPGSVRMSKKSVSAESATLENVNDRLADLDRMNIDIQVIFPTMFLVSVAEDVKLEAALFEAYNRYLGRACAASKGRLRWVALVPFRDQDMALREMRRVKDLGAVGIFTMGMVWDQVLTEPKFLPIYEEAASLQLPVCVHLGWGSRQVMNLFSKGDIFFCSATVPVMWGFMFTMGAGLLDRFLGLKLGFFETGASWVPYAIQQIRRRFGNRTVVTQSQTSQPELLAFGIDTRYYRDPAELFRSGRAVVNCEGDEDFEYLLKHIGADGLMCSSDYPHSDPSAEVDFVEHWRARTDLSKEFKDKVLGKNAVAFFNL